jgi:hypothetical protein
MPVAVVAQVLPLQVLVVLAAAGLALAVGLVQQDLLILAAVVAVAIAQRLLLIAEVRVVQVL